MQRYFVPPDQFTETNVRITGEDARHISRVMRMKVSDRILCANNQGDVFFCEITASSDQSVQAQILSRIEENPELPIHVAVAQGIPKADKFDTIVQKGTECGASSFIPFQAERSVSIWKSAKQEKKRQRLVRIAKEAAEQSHRSFIPAIEPPMNLHELLAFSQSFDHKLVAYEETAKQGSMSELPALLSEMRSGDSLIAVIGPEGGLASEEVEMLKQSGFRLCGLGPRILRTETSALYLLASISYHFELMSGASKTAPVRMHRAPRT